ncbi:sorting nexin [Anaeramoeba flamelloides]|uniref:Sorting nexin n=1 Tax=Anaeramoeba flamelloides TaxID=1746091 RepID=A0ABQ8YK17_9EUKA|nr:sorting nexin [Anaeramoeba flamelloides]
MLRSVQTKIVYQDIYTFFYKQLLNMEQMYIEEMKCGHIPFESAIEDYIRLCDSVKTADNSKKNAINNYNNSIKVQQKCKSKYEKAKTTENKKK